jgi:hypothetical protein
MFTTGTSPILLMTEAASTTWSMHYRFNTKVHKALFHFTTKKMESRTKLECIIATESTKTPTKIQKQRLGIIVIHYHYARLVSILHSALAISNAPLVFSHGLLSTEHSLGVCP